jgi:hypothetical protein
MQPSDGSGPNRTTAGTLLQQHYDFAGSQRKCLFGLGVSGALY